MTFRRLLLVFLGGSIGTAARLAVGVRLTDRDGYPVSTFAVNIVGALLIGILAARIPGSTDLRILLGTGVLGGFTTYSAFMTGTVDLWSTAPALAAAYAVASLALGVAAAAAGLRIGRPRRRERAA